jgi:hypothetical protein
MVLTKGELLDSLESEVRLLLHLISKVDPARLDYLPSGKQRSMIQLLRYLVVMPQVHSRQVMAPEFDIDAWRKAWGETEASAKAMSLDQVRAAIAGQPALFARIARPLSGRVPSRRDRHVRG